MSQDLTDDKSTLVQVMAWCRQATSHHLNQWWPRSLSPYGVARIQWVKYVRVCVMQSCENLTQNILMQNCGILIHVCWKPLCFHMSKTALSKSVSYKLHTKMHWLFYAMEVIPSAKIRILMHSSFMLTLGFISSWSSCFIVRGKTIIIKRNLWWYCWTK